MWCILEKLTYKQRRQFKVMCQCGYVGIRRIDHVLSGRTKECKSCSAKRTSTKSKPPVNKTGYGMLSGTMWCSIKAGAKRRGIDFALSPEYVWKLFEMQKGVCALSGVQIYLSRSIKNNNVDWSRTTASLDRIDSSVGYVVGNVQWVHKTVNYIKRDLHDRDFIEWCHLIHANHEPSLANGKGS